MTAEKVFRDPWEVVPGVVMILDPVKESTGNHRRFCRWMLGSILLAEAEEGRSDWTLRFPGGESRLVLVEFHPSIGSCGDRVAYMLNRETKA